MPGSYSGQALSVSDRRHAQATITAGHHQPSEAQVRPGPLAASSIHRTTSVRTPPLSSRTAHPPASDAAPASARTTRRRHLSRARRWRRARSDGAPTAARRWIPTNSACRAVADASEAGVRLPACRWWVTTRPLARRRRAGGCCDSDVGPWHGDIPTLGRPGGISSGMSWFPDTPHPMLLRRTRRHVLRLL
jgi:hypothetical protein